MVRNWLSRKVLVSPGLLLALSVLLVGRPVALGEQLETPRALYIWSPPETGSPVDHYIVQILINDMDIQVIDPVPLASVTIDMEYGNKYLVRVAAVDATGMVGSYSRWSMPYTPEIAPPGF